MKPLEFARPPIHCSPRGVFYVRPSELVRSRVFWEQVEKTMKAIRRQNGKH